MNWTGCPNSVRLDRMNFRKAWCMRDPSTHCKCSDTKTILFSLMLNTESTEQRLPRLLNIRTSISYTHTHLFWTYIFLWRATYNFMSLSIIFYSDSNKNVKKYLDERYLDTKVHLWALNFLFSRPIEYSFFQIFFRMKGVG